ncbi:trypsin-like peptidase domain-containing protein [Actinomadura sp. DC4]|uniref:trypsin-like serine peptidase n=1 Tax=Actinomadura sp. DC4 TaxID=3055069 RepID=UPI0025B226DB|nr:trypsin-like peptidase domain-containing protein [Actinomadura sp. DC4]MDN3356175.1 hypothetical protein [Actinomadura sp. DC4]
MTVAERFTVPASILIALTGCPGAAASGTEGPRAPVAVRAPLSAEVLRAMTRDRLSPDAAVAAYWTAGRMRVAGRPPGGAPPVSRRAGAPLGIAGRTVGKVFFRDAAHGRDFSCSAAVVAGPSMSLLATAGHCVYDAGGTWHQNWIFVPAYDRGRRPYGVWRATWLATFTGWTARKEPDLDVAFVKVAAMDGRPLAGVVGGNGIRGGFSSRTRPVTVVGYPFLPPYPGDRQYQCRRVAEPAGHRLRMACPLTTGASGGPWLDGYDPATGRGDLVGVTTNTDLANTTLWSPPFDDGVLALSRWADRLP